MIWQVWAILVFIGVGSAYLAFVPKRSPVVTSLAAIGSFSVAALGARDLTVVRDSVDPYSTTEAGAAVLLALGAAISTVVLLAALTGQYGDQDPEESPTGGATSSPRSESLLDRLISRMY